MTRTLLLALLWLCQPAYAKKPKAAAEGLWLTSADHGYSIQYPVGWPYPGKSQSVSPPGMKHLFFLTTRDDSLAVDVAAATKEMPAEQYFELVSKVQVGSSKPSPPETAKLKDRSSFRHFRSVERQGPRSQYFVQGILAKKDAVYYVTLTSPKRHPTKQEWRLILGALASLRTGGTTVGGTPAPGLKGGAAVIDIGPDGSSLRVGAPYEVSPWGYTRKFAMPLHSYRRGPIRCEVALLGQAKTGPREMANGLRAKYYESAGKPPKAESAVRSKKLGNGIEVFYYQIGLPSRDDDPRQQWMLEGFFARKGRAYYYLAAAARDEIAEDRFEKESVEALDLIGRIEWPK